MKDFYLIAFAFLCLSETHSQLQAQWIQTNGPYGAYVNSIAVSGRNLFVAASPGGIFLSTNNGTSWDAVNGGLTTKAVWSLCVSGTNIFAGTYVEVYLSTDNGSSWTLVNNGLNHGNEIRSLFVKGGNVFAASHGNGVYLSTNNGTSWTSVNNGITNTDVSALAVSDTNIFAGTTTSVFRRSLNEMATSVDKPSMDLPQRFSLAQNFPNPFNPTMRYLPCDFDRLRYTWQNG